MTTRHQDRIPTGARSTSLIRNVPLPGDWAERAACRGMAPTDGKTPHPFFAGRGAKAVSPEVAEVCGRCPVRAQCRAYALRYPLMGTWAGMSQDRLIEWRMRRRREAS